jgi:integrase
MLDVGRRPDGRRHRRKLTGRTKAEVRTKLAEAKREADLGIAGTTSRQTVAQYLDWWLVEDAPTGKASADTLAGYAEIIRLYVKPHIGAVRLNDLAPQHVTGMLRALANDGKSARTQHHARAVLRRALRRAEVLGMVGRNVAALVESPKQDGHKTDDTMTAAEAERVLAHAKAKAQTAATAKASGESHAATDELHALAVVLLRLGLRKGEALGLRWEDVDLDAEEITIAHTIKFPRGGGYKLTTPKTDDSVRTIPLLATELTVLREHRKAQTARRLAAPVWHEGDDFVFTTGIGTPIHARNATRWWHGLLKDAGVGPRRMHASRHTAATLLLEEGVPLEVVSAILGHSSLAITADIYARVTKDSMRRALSKMDRLATSLATGTTGAGPVDQPEVL